MRARQGDRSNAPKLSSHFAESRILEAAMTVFTTKGVKETTAEDLMSAADLSRRTFYKYFRSKEDVLAALYDLVTAKLVELMRDAEGAEGPSLKGLLAGVDAYLDFHVANGKLLRVVLEEAIHSESQLHRRREWLQTELVRFMDAAVRRASGRRLDPLVFYAQLALLEGLSLHILELGAKPDAIERARRLLHALASQLLGAEENALLPERQDT